MQFGRPITVSNLSTRAMPIPIARRAAGQRHTVPAVSLLAEVDMLDEHDLAVIVLDDVVVAEPIAVLIEIVCALGAWVALDAQDRLADLLRLKALSVVDRESQNMNSVVGPCPREVGRRLVGHLVFRSELLGCRA